MSNIKNKKPLEKVPHFPQKPHNGLNESDLVRYSFKSGTNSGQPFFGNENEDFCSPKKKMHKNLFTHEDLKIRYIPAELKTNSCWYIEYYYLNPLSDKLERVRVKVNHLRRKLKNDRLAKQELKLYCNKINLRLESGWTPVVDNDITKFVTLINCIDDFLKLKQREVRGDTSFKHYSSQLNIFKNWLIANKHERLLPCDFNKSMVMEYMDYILLSKNVSNRTWNNYRSFMRNFFNWLIERNHCTKNFFSEINKKRNEEKTRIPIPIEDRKKIVEYLKKNHYQFFIFTLLEFSCLMRPVEIFRTRIKDIDLSKQVIHLSGEQTKNGKSRDVVIPNNVLSELIQYHNVVHIEKYKPSDYLFSTNYIPGNKFQLSKVATRTWSKLRETLRMPKEYQLYSLRDSFITESMNANVSPLSIQEHADHSSLDITSIYANHKSKEVIEDIKKNSPNFF